MSRRRCTHKLRKIQNRRRNRAARERAARLTEAALTPPVWVYHNYFTGSLQNTVFST
jgi:hypothetical protein